MPTSKETFIIDLAAILAFNTGRQYAAPGQRIACVPLPDGHVMFADLDRNIDGVTAEPMPAEGISLHDFIMHAYDNGKISYGAWRMEKNGTVREARGVLMAALKHAAQFV